MPADSTFLLNRGELTLKSLTAGGTDPHAFSDFWQIPSGSPKPSDPTMLHALFRIIFDQTGLLLTSVVTMSGTDIEPAVSGTGSAQRMRMLFLVEVAELGPIQLQNSPSGEDFGNESHQLDINSVPITLDLGKYRQHAWSREEDLKEFINSGLYPIEERAQYRMMLEAFVLHRQNLAYLHSFNQRSQTGGSGYGFHT